MLAWQVNLHCSKSFGRPSFSDSSTVSNLDHWQVNTYLFRKNVVFNNTPSTLACLLRSQTVVPYHFLLRPIVLLIEVNAQSLTQSNLSWGMPRWQLPALLVVLQLSATLEVWHALPFNKETQSCTVGYITALQGLPLSAENSVAEAVGVMPSRCFRTTDPVPHHLPCWLDPMGVGSPNNIWRATLSYEPGSP